MNDARRLLASQNEKALIIDDHDNAIVGVGLRCGKPALAVYDNEIIRTNLMAGGCDETDAIAYFEHNILYAWHGENSPILMEPVESRADAVRRLRKENTMLLLRIAEFEAREY